MNGFKKIISRLRALFARRQLDAEMEEEIQDHINRETSLKVEAGMNPEEARSAAVRKFGWIESVKETCREQRGVRWIENIGQDIRFGGRMLLKNPGFTSVAVLTLALGIGANTAIFSVVNAVLLRPLPYRQPERLVSVSESNPRLGWPCYTVSLANYLDWREQNSVFDELGAAATGGMGTVTGARNPEQVHTAFVSASLFPMLGIKPLIGRAFLTEEEQRDRADVVLLSENFWRGKMGADPGIVNQTILINGRAFIVAGVMPRQLTLFEPSAMQGWEAGIAQADLWRPLVIWPEKLKWRNMREYLVLGRLKSEITLREAQDRMSTLALRLAQQFPESNKGWGVDVTPWRQAVTRRSSPALFMLSAAAALALLIATSNIASLFLARAAQRRREFAVRVALGAGRFRLARQLLAESLLVSCAGGAAGLLFAHWGLTLLTGVLPSTLPRVGEIKIDGFVLGFTWGISMIAGIASGLVPVVECWRANINETLKKEGRNNSASGGIARARGLLVVAELALVTLLLIAAGLLTRSFLRLGEVHLGFDPRRLVAVDVSLGGRNYTNAAALISFVERLIPRLKEMSGAPSVGTVNALPLDLARENLDIAFSIEGRPLPEPGGRRVAGLRQASPDYFTTLGISLSRGRSFSDLDRRGAPAVALVNESFARHYFPGEDPIGQRLSSPDFGSEPCTIVGVLGDVKHSGLNVAAAPEVFLPHLQSCFSVFTIVVRSGLKCADTVDAVRAAVEAVDRDVPVYDPRTMAQQIDSASASLRFAMLLMALTAGLSVALGAVGIYGVLSSVVVEKKQEFGIRMALGAQRHEILALIVGRGMWMAAVGVVLGLTSALALMRVLRSFLFEIGPTDLLTFAFVTASIGGVAFLACVIPAVRAARIEPMIALRQE